jgi:dephospho-CoA kinase
MLKVGLTGGIASGKSTVAQLFAKHHVPIIDADAITHQLSQPSAAGYQAIVAHFGANILDQQQSINRAKLGKIIFQDESEKHWLEATLHPMILKKIHTELDQLAQLETPYCIIDIPLITHKTQFDFLDRILVVDCPVEQQISRAEQRDDMDKPHIRTIIEHQCSRKQRAELADDILTNDDTFDALAHAVKQLHAHYLSLSNHSD